MHNNFIILYNPYSNNETTPKYLIDPTEKSIYKFDLSTKQAEIVNTYDGIMIKTEVPNLGDITDNVAIQAVKFIKNKRYKVAYFSFETKDTIDSVSSNSEFKEIDNLMYLYNIINNKLQLTENLYIAYSDIQIMPDLSSKIIIKPNKFLVPDTIIKNLTSKH